MVGPGNGLWRSGGGTALSLDAGYAAVARAGGHAVTFLDGLAARPVARPIDADALRAAFGGPLPEVGTDSASVIDALVAAAEPGLVASAGPRYFGFVTGGAVPAAVGADWLTAAWDQLAVLGVSSPAAAVCEEVVAAWLLELLDLPAGSGVGLVTGTQMGNTTCLSVAARTVLRRAGHDPERDGFAGCPPISVVVGAEAHATITRSLRFLGVGSSQVGVADADRREASRQVRWPGPSPHLLRAPRRSSAPRRGT